MNETQKRPLGVTILAILMILMGLLTIVGGIIGLGVSTISSELEVLALFGIMAIIIGILLLPAGYGLLKGKKWAWTLSIVLNIIGVILNLTGLAGGESDAGTVIFSIAITALIIAYLMKPSTKAFCSK